MSFLTRLAKTFRLGRAQYFVGKDLDSNKYYEYPPLDGSTDPRRTRRVIDYKVFKELGEHDQNKLPTQWLMWLRHTRKSAPSIEEILQDQERIRITRHNAKVLEQKDAERRLQLEQRAAEEAQKAHEPQQQIIEPSVSQNPEPGKSRSPRVTAVPTSAVSEEGVDQTGRDQKRKVDMEVWEASRRRVEEKNVQEIDAFTRRAGRRAEMNQQEAERDRAKRAMNKSPLEAFDVSFEDEETRIQQQQQHQHLRGEQDQLMPRFGRSAGPGEEWKPQEWSPAPRRQK